jgi:tetratricopeptide (TPR) repeat protein
VESQNPSEAHEQTIVPLKTGLRMSAAVVTAEPPPWRFWLYTGGALALFVAAAGAVFVALPRWVAEADRERATAVPAPVEAPAPVAEPELSPEELAALEAKAEQLLAQLLTQQARLTDEGAAGWGGEDWVRYTELAKSGDDAYLAEAFDDAIAAYNDALAAGEALFERSAQDVLRALENAQAALIAGNADLALQQYDFALGIEPENEDAKRGRARAERLPEVLTLSRQGDALRDEERLEDAAAAYAQALAIDSEWEPARSALDAVARQLASNQYESRMSSGLAALAGGEYQSAAEDFRAALALRPSSSEARDGLVQAEQGAKLDEIALAEARALAFERRERWAEAIAQYEAALVTDQTLAFARDGLARATARADLDAKLGNLIDNPNLLFRDSVLEEARRLRDAAGAVAEPGPRLEEQKSQLDRMLTLASTPLKVQIRSDELTEVTVYRVGPLGTFGVKEVELRPGTYTAIGSRNGYRDVRTTFTVLPGRELPPISVVCSEPI